MEQEQKTFDGWAVVELFGHSKAIGYVTTEYYGTACMFRIDTPGLDGRDYELERPEWGINPDDRCEYLLPKGTKVKREAVPARSRLVGPGSVFAINPCTEQVALRQIERSEPRPLIAVEMPKDWKKTRSLPGEVDDYDDGQGDDEMEEEDDEETVA